jgi:hypothetical protein
MVKTRRIAGLQDCRKEGWQEEGRLEGSRYSILPAILQSCNPAILQSCNLAILQLRCVPHDVEPLTTQRLYCHL